MTGFGHPDFYKRLFSREFVQRIRTRQHFRSMGFSNDIINHMLNGQFVRPSEMPNSSRIPRGTRTIISPNESPQGRFNLTNENIAADILTQRYGYDVLQNPLIASPSDIDPNLIPNFLSSTGRDITRNNPDLIIEGTVYDVVTPNATTEPLDLASSIGGKSHQAEGVIVMLDNISTSTFQDMQNITIVTGYNRETQQKIEEVINGLDRALNTVTKDQLESVGYSLSQVIFIQNGEIVGTWVRSQN